MVNATNRDQTRHHYGLHTRGKHTAAGSALATISENQKCLLRLLEGNTTAYYPYLLCGDRRDTVGECIALVNFRAFYPIACLYYTQLHLIRYQCLTEAEQI